MKSKIKKSIKLIELLELCFRIGTLRSPTATSTKTSSQNTTLLYLKSKSFVIIPSCSRHILLAKYAENELVRAILR